MYPYHTIVVDVDGSEISELTVKKAAAITFATGGKLIMVSSYNGRALDEVDAISDILKDDAYLVRGSSPVDEILRKAAEQASACGANGIVRCPVPGPPAKALLDVAAKSAADLLVVGDRGRSTAIGRRWGTLQDEVIRKSGIDVLVVYPEVSGFRPSRRGAPVKSGSRGSLRIRPLPRSATAGI